MATSTNDIGFRVHCLALDGADLTSPVGKMTMQVIAAVAEFERDLLFERTHSGIIRAKAAGKRFGHPPVLNQEERQQLMVQLDAGVSVALVAHDFNITRQTVLRVREAALSKNVND